MAGAVAEEKVANAVAAAAVEALSGQMVAMRADVAPPRPSPAAVDRADQVRIEAANAAQEPGGAWYFDRVNADARLTPEQQRELEKATEDIDAQRREEWAGIKDGARPLADAWNDLTEDPASFAQQWWNNKMALYDDLDEDFNGTVVQMGKDAIFWDERQAGNVDYANGAMLPGLAAQYLIGRTEKHAEGHRGTRGGDVPGAPTLPRRNVTSGTRGDFNPELQKPAANTRYIVDKNIQFDTDGQSRTVRMHAEDLQIRPSDDKFRDEGAQRREGGTDRHGKGHPEPDDGGHALPTFLGGPGEAINLTAMDRNLNQGIPRSTQSYYTFEQDLKKLVEEGRKVDLEVDIRYDGDSQRPSEYIMNYWVDGELQAGVGFKNEPPKP